MIDFENGKLMLIFDMQPKVFCLLCLIFILTYLVSSRNCKDQQEKIENAKDEEGEING